MAEKQRRKKQNINPFGSDIGSGADDSANVKLFYGAHVDSLPLAGLKVREAREKLINDGLEIDPKAKAIVDQHEVDEDTVLTEGQELVFWKPSAEKGNDALSVLRVVELMTDEDSELDHRANVSLEFARECNGETRFALFKAISNLFDNTKCAHTIASAKVLHEHLKTAPQRPATVIYSKDDGRLGVISSDGSWVFPAIPIDMCKEKFESGDTLTIDSSGTLVTGRSGFYPRAGHFCRFVRKLGDDAIEIEDHHGDKLAAYASKKVIELCDSGDLLPGDYVVYDEARRFALDQVEAEDRPKHMFVDESRIPNVDWDTDVANKHPAFSQLMDRSRSLVFEPERFERFQVSPFVSVLCSGPTGTGKTHHIKSFIRYFYHLIEKKLGHKEEGSRVVRARPSELLSMWVGNSERLIDKFFDDLLFVAREKVADKDGNMVQLPVIVIFEEVDGLSPQRVDNSSGGAINRIMTTFLQRFDDPNDEIAHLPIIAISTTNKPQNLDAAMRRRLAKIEARFGRLDRDGFRELMQVRVPQDYPIMDDNKAALNRDSFIERCVESIWNEERLGVRLALKSRQEVPRYLRDFVTPSILDCAFSESAEYLTFQYPGDPEEVGMCPGLLVDRVYAHVEGILSSVNNTNAADHTSIPEGDAVVGVKPLEKE